MYSRLALAGLVLAQAKGVVCTPPPTGYSVEKNDRLAKKQESYGYMSVGYYVSVSPSLGGQRLTPRPTGTNSSHSHFPTVLISRVIYQDYPVSSIPVDRYTHLLYSFANMSAEGTVYLSDPYADTQVRVLYIFSSIVK
jgi:GH18 family chitinase